MCPDGYHTMSRARAVLTASSAQLPSYATGTQSHKAYGGDDSTEGRGWPVAIRATNRSAIAITCAEEWSRELGGQQADASREW